VKAVRWAGTTPAGCALLLVMGCGGQAVDRVKEDAGVETGVYLPCGPDPEPEGGSRDVGANETSLPDTSVGYPAPHVPAPQAIDYGGPVLDAPNIVPIFFADDPFQSSLEDFLRQLAASSYWPAVTAEYSVGPLTIAPSIVVSDPVPASITESEIEAWLTNYLDGTHAAWPPIAQNNIYMVFYPSLTSITGSFGASCTNFGGYHSEGFELGGPDGGTPEGGATEGGAKEGGVADASAEGGGLGGVSFVYAVLPRCASFDNFTGIDAVTGPTSHEAVEAATDPLPFSGPAYYGVDADHSVWDLTPGGELGDLCAFEPQSFQRLVGSSVVQRIWSNVAAASGQDPCVPPLPSTVYFNAAPDLTESVALGGGTPTIGIRIPVGQTKTVNIQFFSTGPTSTWTVSVEDNSFAMGGPAQLEFEPSTLTGQNGDVIPVKVTALATGALGGAEMILYSYRDPYMYDNYWFGFVEN
jgi:hypothetical protein